MHLESFYAYQDEGETNPRVKLVTIKRGRTEEIVIPYTELNPSDPAADLAARLSSALTITAPDGSPVQAYRASVEVLQQSPLKLGITIQQKA